MQLSHTQLTDLEKNGFLILPELFSETEVNLIKNRLPALFEEKSDANIIERHSGVVRTAMGLHKRDDLFADLVRHPRLIEPALQILKEAAYVQQVKVNVKAAFSGEIWQWHTDFATHHEEDGVPQPLALNLHILLDEVTEFNGPLYFVPGSHRDEEHPSQLDEGTTSYPLWVTDQDRVSKMAKKYGMVSATGKPGTVLIFHDTLIHGSPNNMSPWDRSIFSLIVNPISNAYTKRTRPEHKHHEGLTPILANSNDCLLKHKDYQPELNA